MLVFVRITVSYPENIESLIMSLKVSSKLILSLALLSVSACAAPLASTGPGGIYTEVTEAVQANNGVRISKSGEACAQNILGIVSTGDSTVATAKKMAGISNVATIDRSFWSILGVYAKACTQVAGS
jgi:hypothetical protein